MTTQQALDGYDPLGRIVQEGEESLAHDPQKSVVTNILNSYTGFFDVFAELLQNALDAVEARFRIEGSSYKPRLWVNIDMRGRRVRVVDNGIGMGLEELKGCFTPHITFKKGSNLRGQKGVGATYLAYGFSYINVQTKKDHALLAAHLRAGRQWAEDQSGTVPRPKLEQFVSAIAELAAEKSGTAVEIILGNSPGERPRDLGWIGAHTADQWLNVLRIKTPLGGVYLTTAPFSARVVLSVTDLENAKSEAESANSEYYYPHEIPNMKVAALSDITTAAARIDGDATTKFSKLAPELKKLDCMYDLWKKDELLAENSPFAAILTDEQRLLVERHNVVVYAAFLSSARRWGEFNDQDLKLRKGQRIMHGGLQLACDWMIQGDPVVIPLTSTIGYQANTHVIVHFTDGNPDMGRKVFQPELKQMAEAIAVRCVTIFKRFLTHRRPDTGPSALGPDKELHEWKKLQEQYRDTHPLSHSFGGRKVAMLSTPQQEQDVVSLFHELIGVGLLRGIRFFSTSTHERYDSLYQLEYEDDEKLKWDRQKNPLGVASALVPTVSEPRVLEYKLDFDSLVGDFDREEKFAKHINFVVCWNATSAFKDQFYLNSLLVGDEGSGRVHYGATHQAIPAGSGEAVFEVLLLSDLLSFLSNPDEEIARQRHLYRD